MALQVSRNIVIPDHEIIMHAMRSQGAGGQNVNKVASAIHLRFDIHASSLPEGIREKLLALNDDRITQEGVVVIRAQQYRTQQQNREEARHRLKQLIKRVIYTAKPRKPTGPSRSAKRRRLEHKKQRGQRKALRGRVDH
ncbi:alternative ribosome rescue aminoacyl-tRNA hydrolase ArfB [Kushneria phosphatilytica]|uniref:Aminoacyl-tRNA hydrolase n=1 Tax=Kushneria phosphatilytica TaxID=657387 RepID=A0A1S1NWZ7_9GAMM|nr:alternative ribosome rescue aminoacyl-tRNA hydrolase ArfB [Kushneria phosphatilytica]OHV12090.1 class I peptide chain release factor [Kushneria phosphatilytica]QEL11284.1 aminoacyl-tRNA hydrolase [Kushneria phosphatilytica]